MNTETAFDKAAAIFEQVLGLPDGEQQQKATQLADGDSEVLALLASMMGGHAQGPSGLDEPLLELEPEPAEQAMVLPEQVGPYRILGLLGEGGMGVVLEAEQSNPSRRVALKLLRGGSLDPSILKRFEHEAKVLGWLNHPGIAHVFEAGVAQIGATQQPYIAMELVVGQKLDHYCVSADLELSARLGLIADLCDAVHHAHQRGVVHRDLKPGNILVTEEGQVKVLDFGIARITDSDLMATSGQTMTGQVIGTLPYMSPEQVAADSSKVEARSDVYALGVIAYELLVGSRPIAIAGHSLPEAARMITEDEPTTLGVLDKRLRGDVEVIVGRALIKEREQRYASAGDMADDIRRHLNHEPILARAPSTAYQFKKFVRRNRIFVFGAAALVLMSVGFAITMAIQANRVTKQRDVADRKTVVSEEVAKFLVELFEVSEPEGARADQLSARDVLDIGAKRIQTQFKSDPALRSELLVVMGRTYSALGLVEEASPLIEEAVALREDGSQGWLPLLVARSNKAQLLSRMGKFKEAVDLSLELVDVLEQHPGAAPEQYFSTLVNLGYFYLDMGQRNEAAAIADRLHREMPALEVPALSEVLFLKFRGSAYEENGKFKLAEADLQEAERRVLELKSGDDPLHISILRAMSDLYQRMTRIEDCRKYASKALELDRRVFGDNHPNVDRDLFTLASATMLAGDYEEALVLFEEVLERDKRNLGDHPYVGVDHTEVATILSRLGRFEEANERYEIGYEIQKSLLPTDHPELATTLNNMANHFGRMGDRTKSLEMHNEVLRIRRLTLKDTHPHILTTRNSIGVSLADLGRYEEAAAIQKGVLEDRIQVLVDHAEVGGSHYTYSHTLMKLERYDESLEHLGKARQIWEKHFKPDSAEMGRLDHLEGMLLMRLERWAEAGTLVRRSIASRGKRFPPGDPHLLGSKVSLARCLAAQGDFSGAEKIFLAVVDQSVESHGLEAKRTQRAWEAYVSACEENQSEPIRKHDIPATEPADASADK